MQSESSEQHEGASIVTFNKVWVVLLLLTGVEVFLAYIQLPTLIMLVSFLGLSIIKAAMIIAYFMHLKFERFSLFLTLFPMLIMCILLMMFVSMPDSTRLLNMRPPQ
jgi:cytochrome c oxidase subunit IV